jgi:hypothetical protein
LFFFEDIISYFLPKQKKYAKLLSGATFEAMKPKAPCLVFNKKTSFGLFEKTTLARFCMLHFSECRCTSIYRLEDLA